MREATTNVMMHTADKIIKIIAKPYLSAIIPAIIAKIKTKNIAKYVL